jgi:preprotein translocase subunit SecD
MKVSARRFNLYLAMAMMLALFCGCQTHTEKKKAKEKVAALRIHLQVNENDTTAKDTVSVLRSSPLSVTVGHDPVLTEANILKAAVMDTPGGFSVEVKFDATGTLMLEQYSAANPGRHFVIFGQWGAKLVNGRWLAAPLITHRISSGVLAFTPDMSRTEADQLVLGLNNVSAKVHKGMFKS